ncbi:MAG: hypothetical protein GF350_09625, partial [Chitinivibrionales bacterium]|nr:hypothetical protein [Chitinivibrionales bacterium]
MKSQNIIVSVILVFVIALVAGDRLYLSRLTRRFKQLEQQRIVTSNKLATAKIIHENLNHVRELVFQNMDFKGEKDTINHQSEFYSFVTACMNDLKLKLISFSPQKPEKKGTVTTSSYDIEF